MIDSLFILAVLALLVAVSEELGRTGWGRHLGSALLVIVLTATAANLGLIPTYSDDIAVYHGIFGYVAPLAIFLLVLQVNLRDILKAGLPMIAMFLLGALGTVLGVLAGLWLVDGANAFGPLYKALGGMFVATYIGGSVNYNAVALHYDVVKNGTLYAGAAAVDSAMTAVWMAVTVALPRLLGHRNPAGDGQTASGQAVGDDAVGTENVSPVSASETTVVEHDAETVSVTDLGYLMALAGVGVWISGLLGAWLHVPSILLVTTFALVLAQVDRIRRMPGIRMTGWLAVMFFLAVIGALCDLEALAAIGEIGPRLILFVVVLLAVHGLVIFGAGALFRLDPTLTAVASQANIGGSTSALALARSLGREQWVLPGVLAGALGNALGTYLGFLAVAVL